MLCTDSSTSKLQLTSGSWCFVADCLRLVEILKVDGLNTRRLGMIDSAAGTD